MTSLKRNLFITNVSIATTNKIAFLVHTEYHLMISLMYLSKHQEQYTDSYIIIKNKKGNQRINKNIDISEFSVKTMFIEFDYNFNKKLSEDENNYVDKIADFKLSEFCFFQEQDPFMLLLISILKKQGTCINLYPDGLKPYAFHTLKFSLMMHLENFKQNIWIKKNSFEVNDWFSFLKCNKYGFLKEIDCLSLQFPTQYNNWRNITIKEIKFKLETAFIDKFKKVLSIEHELLEHQKNVIFYMNQPFAGDNGLVDYNFLNKIRALYPTTPIYVKNHPLVTSEKTRILNEIENLTLIQSNIPAEVYIASLKNSILFSVSSASLFMDNDSCLFYYLYKCKEFEDLAMLKKIKYVNPTEHVKLLKDVSELPKDFF